MDNKNKNYEFMYLKIINEEVDKETASNWMNNDWKFREFYEHKTINPNYKFLTE